MSASSMLPDVSRQERRLIRQRGAGARELTDTAFTFTFGAGSPNISSGGDAHLAAGNDSPPTRPENIVPVKGKKGKTVPPGERKVNSIEAEKPKKRGRPKVEASPAITQSRQDNDDGEISVAAPLVKKRRLRTMGQTPATVPAICPHTKRLAASPATEPPKRRRPRDSDPDEEERSSRQPAKALPNARPGNSKKSSARQPTAQSTKTSVHLDEPGKDDSLAIRSDEIKTSEDAHHGLERVVPDVSEPVKKRRGRPPKPVPPETASKDPGKFQAPTSRKKRQPPRDADNLSSHVEHASELEGTPAEPGQNLAGLGKGRPEGSHAGSSSHFEGAGSRKGRTGGIETAPSPVITNMSRFSKVNQEAQAPSDTAKDAAPALLTKKRKPALFPPIRPGKRAAQSDTEQEEDPGDLAAILRRYGDPKIPAKLVTKGGDTRFKFRF